jgi:ATP-binding cassette subfamily F protein uup
MIGRGIFANPFAFANVEPTTAESSETSAARVSSDAGARIETRSEAVSEDSGSEAADDASGVNDHIAERIDLGNGRIMSASQFLEYFMFTDKQQYSLVEKLSGGERRRLYLLTVLMGNPNFLILDEPTNDLDIITLNVLEEYLKGFKGCLLIVSHDRFFTDKVVDRIFAFEGNGIVKDFPGNYTIYKNKKEEEKEQLEKIEKEKKKTEQPQSTPNNSVEKKRKLSFKERQEMQQLETDMEQLNTEKTIIETALNSGNLSPEELVAQSNRIAEIIAILDEKEMRWLELSEI